MKQIFAVFILACLVAFTSCEEECGCTDSTAFNYDEKATKDDGSCTGGCLGYNAQQLAPYGTVISSFGDAYYDQIYAEEVIEQRNFFQGIPANVYILREVSPERKNAFATSDGDIMYGYYLFNYMADEFNELGGAGVMAHEWGHRTQFEMGWQNYNLPAYRELEADAFAGFYMYLNKQWAWSIIDGYYDAVFASGDYAFNSPQHHGTPDERLQSAYLGVSLGNYVIQNNVQLSYADLHDYFIQEIQRIKPRSAPVAFAEIEFPAGLSREYVKSLFPRK